MTYVPLKYQPGVCKVNSPYTDYMEGGRYTHMQGMRFVAGYPEVIGRAYDPGFLTVQNVVRGMMDIRTSTSIYLITGETVDFTSQLITSTGIVAGYVTPYRLDNTGNLVNPFNTVNGTNLVTVTHTAHKQKTGDYIQLGTTTAGGVTIGGVYNNIQVTGTNAYTFLAGSAASATTTAVGGTVAYSYFRNTLVDAIVVSSNSGTATVTHATHGATAGDGVIFENASAVGGVTLNGRYEIASIVDANNYTILNGTATANGTGGGTFTVKYNITNDADRVTSFSRYGSSMLASPSGDTIYIWDPEIGINHFRPLTNAPSGVNAMFVTPERFPFALGNSDNQMQVKWPNQTDITVWSPVTADDTANARTLQIGSKLVGGIAVRDGLSLVLSDLAAYAFIYTGDSFVYNSTLAATGCGLIGKLAIANIGNVVFWMGANDFWMFDGSVQKLPSDDIRDWVFQALDKQNAYKCVCGTIAAKNEVWFLFPAVDDSDNDGSALGDGGGECSRYAIWHIDQQCWSTGAFTNYITSLLDNQYPSLVDSSEPYSTPYAAWASSASNAALYLFDYDGSADDGGILFPGQYILGSPIALSFGGERVDIFGAEVNYKNNFDNNFSNGTTILSCTLLGPDTLSGRMDNYVNASLVDFSLAYPNTRADLRESAKYAGVYVSVEAGQLGRIRLGPYLLDIQRSGQHRGTE